MEIIDMILDVLENSHRYLAFYKGFAKAFDFLLRPDLKELPVGKYDIDADRVYAIVSKEHGREPDAWISTKNGSFAIFFPEDAHMPLISSGQIHKVVVKIAVAS